MRVLLLLAFAYAAALLAQSAQHALAPQRDGPLAIVQIVAPHLFLPLVVLVPLALLLRRRSAIVVLVLAGLVGLVRFGPGMVPAPSSIAATDLSLRVATWNLAAGEASASVLVQRLLAADAQIVALPELTHQHAAAIEGSADLAIRYPHRLLAPDASVRGMGLLSEHPARELQQGTSPPHILAEVDLPGGPTLGVLAAHPLPSRFTLVGGVLPVGYYAGDRDHDLLHLRSMVEHRVSGGEPLLVLGDLNVTDRELAYAQFTAGLADAHRHSGIGPGSTWRPHRLSWLPVGILRIDYVLTGGPITPIDASTECNATTGDHCILWSTIAVPTER